MRNLMLQTVISMLLLSIAFVGCEKEKENDKKETSSTTTTNKFTYNSKAYETPKGYLDKWGVNSDNESADFDVTLCSSSVNYSVELDEYSGTGHTVYIDLNSPSLTELAPGTYTYDTSYYSSDTATRKANTFVDASVAVDYDFDNDTGTEYYTGYSSTGTVTIKKTDSTYREFIITS